MTRGVWFNKSLKELKQISMDWKTGFYEDSGKKIWTNPNGNPKDNKGYYTPKKKFYNEFMNKYNSYWARYYAKNPIQRDTDQYNNWAEMRDGVNWFDTAACWKSEFIGAVNWSVITPNISVNQQRATDPNKSYTSVTRSNSADPNLNVKSNDGMIFTDFWEQWYIGANYAVDAPETDFNGDPAYHKLIAPKDKDGPFQ